MKKKEKKEENKIWKWFRHLTSLGVGGAVLFLFPNFVITQLSFLVGILVGKGIISMSLGFAITTFLGSQAGLWLQKGILALLSYIISNLTLKLSGKFVSMFKNNNKEHKIENKTTNYNSKQFENRKNNSQQINNQIEKNDYLENQTQYTKNKIKKLGTHPSYRK